MRIGAPILPALLSGILLLGSTGIACAQKKKPRAKAAYTAVALKRILPDSNVLKNIPAEAHAEMAEYSSRFRTTYTALRNSRRDYLAFVGSLLARYRLPDDFKVLTLIESHINPEAVSRAGAVGIWQLMPALAKESDLSDDLYDERKDMYKSTLAAVKFLHSLYGRFHDRLLVVAAYNCGAGCVSNALKTAPVKNFWAIQAQLPQETQNHVLKYLAGIHILYDLPVQAPQRSSARTPVAPPRTVPESPFSAPRKTSDARYLTLQITPSFRSEAIIQYTGIDGQAFQELNTDMKTRLARDGSYELRLPEKYMLRFLAQKSQILKASLSMP